MKRVAITGATSMIGCALVEFCLNEGMEVIAFIRKNSSKLSVLPISKKLKIIEADLADFSALNIDAYCDVFFHLGWGGTNKQERNDTMVQLKNIEYTLDAIRLAHKMNAKRFIGSGSQAEYGVINEKITKDTPVNPNTAYGIAKYASGKLGLLECQNSGIEFIWARIFSAYGIGDRADTLVMHVINSFLKGETPKLTSCNQTWDFIYSEDVARAMFSLAQKGINGKSYLIASGHSKPLYDFVMEVKSKFGNNISIEFGAVEQIIGKIVQLDVDINEIVNDTGFKAEVEFSEGIDRIIKWMNQEEV